MARNRVIVLSSTLLFIMACIINTSASTPGGIVGTKPAVGGHATATSGSADFFAQATSPQSVKLVWKAVDGATGYNLEFGWNGKDFYPLAVLSPSLTQYEDFTALPGSTESYRLQAVTSSGPGEWLRADATTSAASPKPIAVKPTYDILKAVTATIGAAGGSLSLTDSSGVKYKLDIPAGALSQDTAIQLVPITGLEAWPLDGQRLAAVRIDPAGVQLAEVGNLTITLKSPGKADLTTVGFGFQLTGDDFHLERVSSTPHGTASRIARGGGLAAPAPQLGSGITIPIIELMVHGVGQGSTSAIADLARNNAPADAGAAVEQQQAAADADLAGLPLIHNDTGNKDAARRLEGELAKIEDQIREASDGDALGAAMKEFEKWQKDTAALTPSEYSQLTDFFWEMMTGKLKDLLDKATEECKKSTGVPPAGVGQLQQILESTLNPPSSGSDWSILQNKMTSAYGTDVLTKAWSDLKNGVCGPYKEIGNAGYTGKICSLARPFTLNNSFGGSIVVTFIPVVVSRGIVHVTQHITANRAFTDTFGTYDVEFQPNGEAFLHYLYSGILYVPGEPGIPFSTHKDQVDIKRTDDPSCK